MNSVFYICFYFIHKYYESHYISILFFIRWHVELTIRWDTDTSYTMFVSFPMTFSTLLYKFLFTYYLSLIRFTEMLSMFLIWFLFYVPWLCLTFFFVVCAYIRLNVETLKNLLFVCFKAKSFLSLILFVIHWHL